jgi:L-amino acid N-acyltransferase YncA/histidinol phosphatase-like enzyme
LHHSDPAPGTLPSAVFFDLKGTLVARCPEREGAAAVLPGVREAADRLPGVPLFIIANQSELGEEGARVEAERLFAAVNEQAGGRITAARFCPHPPEAGCPGHKPAPGLLIDLAAVCRIDLTRAWSVGDTPADRECARRAGVAQFHWAQSFFAPAAHWTSGVRRWESDDPARTPTAQRLTPDVRPATEADLPGIVQIYNEAIEERISTCDLERVTVAARRPWFERFDDRHPLHVAVAGEAVVGWSAMLPYDPKPGYAGLAEHSIYVARAARGAGLGRRLLEHLIETAGALGHRAMLGRIFRHNDRSLELHRRLGFEEVGVLPRAALLDGREADVVFMLRHLWRV